MKDNMTDLQMIQSPLDWPSYPFLPIKRYHNHNIETAVLWTGSLLKATAANIWDLPKTKEEFIALPGITYQSVESMLADKWIVD